MELNKNNIKKIILIITFGISFTWLLNNFSIATGLLKAFWGIIFPFIIGLIIAFLINIPMSFFERKLFKNLNQRLKRTFSLLISVFLILAIFTLTMFIIIPQLAKTISSFSNSFPAYWQNTKKSIEPYLAYMPQLQNWLSTLDWQKISENILPSLSKGTGNFLGSAANAAFSVINGVTGFFIGFLFAIYVLFDKEHLKAQTKGLLKANLNEKKYNRLVEIIFALNNSYSRFVTGQLTESFALTIVFFIVLTIGRFEYSLLISVMIGLFSLIPVIGSFIGCIISALLLFVGFGFWRALAFIIVFIVVQQLDGAFMYPRIVGASVGLPALWVLFAVSIGGKLFGIFGMILFIPLFSVIYSQLHKKTREKLNAKGIPSPLEEYKQTLPVKKKKIKKNKNK